MIKRITYIALFLLLTGCSKEETPVTKHTPSVQFVKTYGGTKNDVAHSVVATKNGGYAILGYTQSNNEDITSKTNESFDVWLLKFSSNDTLEWKKTYGGTKDDRGYNIINTLDNGFLITGFSKSDNGDATNNKGFEDVWALKIDASGTIQWSRTFGFLGTDKGFTAIQTTDGGFLIGGVLDVTASGGQGNSKSAKRHAGGDYWLLKLNNKGVKEWSKYYGGTFTDTLYGITETENNEFILVGSSDSEDVDIQNNKGTYDFWVVKISSKGHSIWHKNYGGSEIDEARGIVKTNNHNFIIVGDTRSNDKDITKNYGGADCWILKINADGTILWQKTYGGSSFDVARSIKKMNNGFLIAGSSRSSDNGIDNKGQNDAWIFSTNFNGSLNWQITVGGSEIDFLYDAVQLPNNSIIAVGESTSKDKEIPKNKGFSDLLIIKIK